MTLPLGILFCHISSYLGNKMHTKAVFCLPLNSLLLRGGFSPFQQSSQDAVGFQVKQDSICCTNYATVSPHVV